MMTVTTIGDYASTVIARTQSNEELRSAVLIASSLGRWIGIGGADRGSVMAAVRYAKTLTSASVSGYVEQ